MKYTSLLKPYAQLYFAVCVLSLSRTDFRWVWLLMAFVDRTRCGCIGQPSQLDVARNAKSWNKENLFVQKDCNFVSNHISIETLSWNLLFELLAWEANITACELLKLLYRSMLRTRLRFQKLNMQKTKMRSSINLTLNWIHVVSTTLFDSIVLKISQTLAFRS